MSAAAPVRRAGSPRAGAPAWRAGPADLAHLARTAGTDDVALGVRLLRSTATNEDRDDEALRAVSVAAQEFGAALARRTDAPAGPAAPRPRVVERTGGMASGSPVVARYLPRRDRVELFTDVVAHCEAVVAALGWHRWFPEGTVRAAALLHEEAHELIAHSRAADLRRAVGVPALRVGRWTRWAHIAGADELAAHAYAQTRLGLPRSPLLITAAAMAAIDRHAAASTPSVEED